MLKIRLILIRVLLVPLGLLKKIVELSIDGSRDINNSFRFKKVKIDKGCSVDRNSILHQHIHILENTIINSSKISSFTYIGSNCLIQFASIGKFCSIANDVLIGLGTHPLNFISTSPLFYRQKNVLNYKFIDVDIDFQEYKPITIGNDVWIGTRVIIVGGISIGHGAVIAANAVVTKNVPPFAIVAGVPATIIKFRFPKEEIERLLKENWWEKSIEDLKMKFKQ
jgi:acetyltransferase-like isoleucine patch superfamily enzyme